MGVRVDTPLATDRCAAGSAVSGTFVALVGRRTFVARGEGTGTCPGARGSCREELTLWPLPPRENVVDIL